MISHSELQDALRVYLATLSVCTTGATTLAATTTGYTRTTGSFVTDGFKRGMELNAAGFATLNNNGPATITDVSALSLTVSKTLAVDAAAAGRRLEVGLPNVRAWENQNTAPVNGQPWVREEYLPGAMSLITLGTTGQLDASPSYVVSVFVPNNTGKDAAGAYADAIISLFAPKTSITTASNVVARVRSEVAPFRGQLLQTESQAFAVVPVTIPLRLRTANAI